MEVFLFYFFGAAIVISAASVILVRNIIYAVLLAVVTFLSVAALFILAYADFAGIAQLVIYVGGILVLLLFGIMLTNRLQGIEIKTSHHNLFWGIVGGVLVLSTLIKMSLSMAPVSGAPITETIRPLGVLLMSRYLIAFELTGLLLLIALIAAAFIAGFSRNSQP